MTSSQRPTYILALIGLLLMSVISCVPTLFSGNNSHHIPANLDESFVQLDSILSTDNRALIQGWPEDSIINLHFGLGMWMRNNWGLWKGSVLSKWFNGLGIFHPDDMSGIILTSYWRYLHHQPIELEGQVKYYIDYWAERTWPDTLVCPRCGKKLKDSFAEGYRLDRSDTTRITIGLYCSSHHVWFYRRSKGLYAIDTVLYRAYLDTLRQMGIAR